MNHQRLAGVVRHLRRAVGANGGDGASDAHLLERFVTERDEAAFELLVWRHGPMVWGVCRRVLGNLHDAEDAFQAALLALARKAGSIGKWHSLSSWLYKVAYRTALRARSSVAKRARHERLGQPAEEPGYENNGDSLWRELRPILDEELSRLPDKYRVPVVLCYLQGKTNEEAARDLRWPIGTVKTRLSKARELLSQQLTRRGVTLTAAALGVALAQQASASLPAGLVGPAVKAALFAAAGQMAVAGVVSARVALLTEGVLKAMFLTKLKTAAAIVLAVGLLGGGAGVWSYQAWGRGNEGAASVETAPASATPMQNPGAKGQTEQKYVEAELKAAAANLDQALAEVAAARAKYEHARQLVAVMEKRLADLKSRGQASEPAKPDTDLTRIQGTWRVGTIGALIDGRGDSAVQLVDISGSNKTSLWKFKGTSLSIDAKEEDTGLLGPGVFQDASFVMEEQKRPTEIDFMLETGSAKGKTIHSRYAVDGDRLRICISAPGAERPKGFSPKRKGERFFDLTRQKATDVPALRPALGTNPVAYIFEDVPLSRAELGEYLIARQGADALQAFVNTRIIEHICRDKGIAVTDAEMEAALEEDIRALGMRREQFVEHIVKQYRKSLLQWKEDVLRPRLLLTKLVRPRVRVSEEEIRDAFEEHYGEKVECRMILWPRDDKAEARRAYAALLAGQVSFDRLAGTQPNAALAARGGEIVISRHGNADPQVEKAAFALKVDGVSKPIDTPDGIVILKCIKRLPADNLTKLENVREALAKEVLSKKIQREIPRVFDELRAQANPRLLLDD